MNKTKKEFALNVIKSLTGVLTSAKARIDGLNQAQTNFYVTPSASKSGQK
jgi:hypothetical protein